MSGERRKFTREPAERRRRALVDAALELVGEAGVQAATVRAIAARAEVSLGLIRHYFSSKEELILAAYAAHMDGMTAHAAEEAARLKDATAACRLDAFVRAGLTSDAMAPANIGIWASFLNLVRSDPAMQAVHARSYRAFRDQLERLIAGARAESGRPVGPQEARRLAIACNAVIDGLWLEGGALPEDFGADELAEIGVQAVRVLTGLGQDQTLGQHQTPGQDYKNNKRTEGMRP